MAMRKLFASAIGVFCILLSLGAQELDVVAKKELEKFQGTWRFVSIEVDGKSEELKDQIIIFEGEKYTVKIGDRVTEAGTFKIDTSKKPYKVDATVTEGDNKGTTALGIYELDGDVMKSCFNMEGKERPKEFKTAAGSDDFLAILKRVEKK
jgi:uncharacterized protein (TIGR03067 family)